MEEKAIFAIEEALLSALFTQRALVEILTKKGIINKKELEDTILKTEAETVGIGKKDSYLYLSKRSNSERRQIHKRTRAEKRKSNRRKGK